MEFNQVIQKRTAIRKFQENKKIEKDKLLQILEAGRIAPTAKNLQPQKILVVSSEKGLAKIDKATPCRYHSPTVLIVCVDKKKVFSQNGYSTAEVDGSIVATHMMLEATNLGIDNIWIEMFDRNILKQEFSLKEELLPICLLPIGYREVGCSESPNHKIRKSLEETVIYVE